MNWTFKTETFPVAGMFTFLFSINPLYSIHFPSILRSYQSDVFFIAYFRSLITLLRWAFNILSCSPRWRCFWPKTIKTNSFRLLYFHSNSPSHKYYLAVDPVSGALFLSDTNSRQIYRVRSLSGVRPLMDNAQVVAGTGEQCVPFDDSRCGDGGKAVEATLMSPRGERHSLSYSLKVIANIDRKEKL